MQRQTKRTRLQVSSWYIGAGNKPSVFTRRPRKPFEKIREKYERQIKKVPSGKKGYKSSLSELSKAEKDALKKSVKSELKKEILKKIFIGILTIILTGILLYALKMFVENYN